MSSIRPNTDEVNSDVEVAKKELETWKSKVEKGDDLKSRLIVEKLDEDEAKAKAKQEMISWIEKKDKFQGDFTQSLSSVQDKIEKFAKCKQDLLEKLRRYQAELELKRAESTKLEQKFKIYAQIPETEVRFNTQDKKECDDDSQPIRGVFTIRQRSTVPLQGGQALVTFEEEKVASQILKIAKCSVSCDNKSVEVKPKRITIDPVVKFEVHLDVSRMDLNVCNIPPSMPEERMKDRLEMSFSRPSRGGGEVKRVDYDANTGIGHITFLHPGVAEGLVLRGSYYVGLDSKVNVQVGPIYKHKLRKFQTFSGSPKRTLLLDGIQDVTDEDDLQDHLEIHFQKPSNCGGEIESIKYLSRGKAVQAIFCEDLQHREE
ncbi:N-myc-interactor [Echeneis naucrates]|uniref:N-myc-interactor-like n=1 Tax=Echeneis naucrates TaxID=173247 RepID=A0A665W6C6_ECHNA|nr:N-myc-interactor-like [Echeneis naucrates]